MAERLVAVVTGANRGIGREIARQLSEHGFSVVLGSRDLAKGQRAARELDPSQKAIVACQLDVTDRASVAALSELVTRRFDRVDVLVNNAAILYDSWQQAAGADLEIAEQALQTNLLGAWRTTQTLLPLLRRSSHPRIVNVSSESGSIAGMTTGGTPAYSVSKAALNALTRLLAGELRADGILVNAVCPGWTATDMGGGGRAIGEGAAGAVWAALLPDGGPTGGFFRDGRTLPW